VTNRNNPELKTLIQKHLHLTRYAPALYVNETETLLSVLNMYIAQCTYEFSIVRSSLGGLRPQSYDKTGLRLASALVLYFWSWCCSFGLGLLVLLPIVLCPTGAV